MNIPLIFRNLSLSAGVREGGNIIDIAPTVCKVLEVEPDGDWEGKVLTV
jgi:arylsulfatase A-like enzyme